MSLVYRAIDWNRQKRVYDLIAWGIAGAGLATWVVTTLVRHPNVTAETLVIRASAWSAITLLHVILAIGPLARLDARFLPLLYNRRHLGVTMFVLALVHAVVATFQFHALGDESPLVSLWTAYGSDAALWRQAVEDWVHVPFEPFGVVALIILLFMAATSHDFWLRHLGAVFWKSLHLCVYLAYGLVLAHVALGYLQSERGIAPAAALGAGFIGLATLHGLAARQERRVDREIHALEQDGYVPVCRVDGVIEGRGRVVVAAGRRLAVWLHHGRWFATSNVCRHQGGPLGEGRIIDGCITCPWHGWNYQPEDGCSPPPFQEIIETHEVRVEAAQVWVRSLPSPLRTRQSGALADAAEAAAGSKPRVDDCGRGGACPSPPRERADS
ncbi:MAG: ferric reductase-like transmembrane domain-containing protein [Verrucomicrobiales bacterium]|nr:ferric reductase-like transmembrane domain-containing protein [Verrucomicrobiales bacterium]